MLVPHRGGGGGGGARGRGVPLVIGSIYKKFVYLTSLRLFVDGTSFLYCAYTLYIYGYSEVAVIYIYIILLHCMVSLGCTIEIVMLRA